MSQFEFVMTLVSVFISFGLVRLLDGLRYTFIPDRRYWVHCSWVVIRLASYVLLWWGSWSIRDLDLWNLARFTLWLLPFGLLYLQSTALVTTSPEEIRNWRDHFYEIRRWFFATNSIFIVILFLSTTGFGAFPLIHPLSISYLLILIVSIAGYLSDSHKVQALVVTIALFNLIFGWGVQVFNPTAIPLEAVSP